ncbi:MAG TPA: hypothetical protein VIC61_00275 [Gammaproteobacteria bacterium]|jgi:hypothetical protein
MSRILFSAGLAALLACPPGLAADPPPSGEAREPLPGELVIPEEMGRDPGTEKTQCMTVCARWGEECILINKGAGGMERKCRRTCQQFAEECF